MRWHNSLSRHRSLPGQPVTSAQATSAPGHLAIKDAFSWAAVTSVKPVPAIKSVLRPVFLAIKGAFSRPAAFPPSEPAQAASNQRTGDFGPRFPGHQRRILQASRYLGEPLPAIKARSAQPPPTIKNAFSGQPAFDSHLRLPGAWKPAFWPSGSRLPAHRPAIRSPASLATCRPGFDEPPAHSQTGWQGLQLTETPGSLWVGIRSALVTRWLIAGSPAPVGCQGNRMVRGSQAARRQGEQQAR